MIFSRRFLPFFLAQTLGALNDNFYRNALVLLITFVFVEQLGSFSATLAALTAAIFVFPFFMCSATAGRLADQLDKAQLVQWLKWMEVVVMILAAIGFWLMNIWVLLGMLFLLGIQAALFGPVKYAILPQLLPKERLLAANAWVEASTFIMILIGTLLSSSLMLTEHGRLIVSLSAIGCAVAGAVAARFIPPLPSRRARPTFRLRILRDTWRTLLYGLCHPQARYPLLGIGWFWALGSVYLSQLPHYAKTVLADDGSHVGWLLASFTIGIALGSFACARIQRGQITDRTVAAGAWGMGCFAIALWLTGASGTLATSMAILIGFAACGGLFIVPLYTLMQHHAQERRRGRMIAASNIVSALTMTAASLASGGFLAMGLAVEDLLVGWGAATILVYHIIGKLRW